MNEEEYRCSAETVNEVKDELPPTNAILSLPFREDSYQFKRASFSETRVIRRLK